MSELRWNPLLGTYTMIAANRQGRPNLPTDGCPFCPESGKTPANFTVLAYDNDFPTLSSAPETPSAYDPNSPYHTAESYGKCEVVLYSPDHHKPLWRLPQAHLIELVELWRDRMAVLSADPRIKYVFPFENRGEAVGVTIHHPHGQIYAYPFIPLKIKTELDNAILYRQKTGQNLLMAMNEAELRDERRIVTQNAHFLVYLPHFTDYPFGVFIVARRNAVLLTDFSSDEIASLAEILRDVTGMFDALYGKPFPYMMCLHQGAVNSPEYADAADYFAFHIEFYPPLRDENRIKYYASSEMGAWAAANTRAVEDTAIELREALARFKQQG